MNRIAYIRGYIERRQLGDNSILYALIRCLSLNEGLTLLHESYINDLALRDAVLYVLDDLEGKDREALIDSFSRGLIQDFAGIPANRRSSVFLCLGTLLNRVSDQVKHEIKVFLLSSKYAAGRRKGLKLLESDEVSRYRILIEQCSIQYGEYHASMLIVRRFSPEYVYENRQTLLRSINAPSAIARLYLRAAEFDSNCISELEEYDGITFAYVKAKRGEKIGKAKALSLLEEYRLDDRIGLLAWSFGKLGLWDVITKMAESFDDWTQERAQQLRERYDLSD